MSCTGALLRVHNPRRVGDGMSAYTVYSLTAQFPVPPPGCTASSFEVTRRFSDFVWLRDVLAASAPHIIMPALPEKQTLGRMATAVVEQRARALSRWLTKLAAHAHWASNSHLFQFFTLPTDGFARYKEHNAVRAGAGVRVAAAASTAGAGVKRLFTFNKGDKRTSAEDLSFAEIEAYLGGHKALFSSLYTAAAAVATRHRAQSQALLNFGASLRGWSTAETGGAGQALASIASAQLRACSATYELAVQETELVVERIADYVRGVASTAALMEERTRASDALASALSTVERLVARQNALAHEVSASAAAERDKLVTELAVARETVTSVQARYDTVATAAVAEVDAWKVGMRGDFRAILLDFTHAAAAAAAAQQTAWAAAVPEISRCAALEGLNVPSAVPTSAAQVTVGAPTSVAGAMAAAAAAAAATAGAGGMFTPTAPGVPRAGMPGMPGVTSMPLDSMFGSVF